MRLHARDSLEFAQITHHKKTTQCLGALGDSPWCVIPRQKSYAPPHRADAHRVHRATRVHMNPRPIPS